MSDQEMGDCQQNEEEEKEVERVVDSRPLDAPGYYAACAHFESLTDKLSALLMKAGEDGLVDESVYLECMEVASKWEESAVTLRQNICPLPRTVFQDLTLLAKGVRSEGRYAMRLLEVIELSEKESQFHWEMKAPSIVNGEDFWKKRGGVGWELEFQLGVHRRLGQKHQCLKCSKITGADCFFVIGGDMACTRCRHHKKKCEGPAASTTGTGGRRPTQATAPSVQSGQPAAKKVKIGPPIGSVRINQSASAGKGKRKASNSLQLPPSTRSRTRSRTQSPLRTMTSDKPPYGPPSAHSPRPSPPPSPPPTPGNGTSPSRPSSVDSSPPAPGYEHGGSDLQSLGPGTALALAVPASPSAMVSGGTIGLSQSDPHLELAGSYLSLRESLFRLHGQLDSQRTERLNEMMRQRVAHGRINNFARAANDAVRNFNQAMQFADPHSTDLPRLDLHGLKSLCTDIATLEEEQALDEEYRLGIFRGRTRFNKEVLGPVTELIDEHIRKSGPPQ